MRVIACEAQPTRRHHLTSEVNATRACQVRIKIRSRAARTCRRGRQEFKTHNVVKPVRKIIHTEFSAIVPELLFDSGAPRLARFRLQSGISGETRECTVCLIESRFFDSLTIEEPKPGFTPEISPL